MIQKSLRILFLIFLLMPVLWMSGKGGYALYQYFVMSASAPATSVEWSVASKSSDEHYLHATYTFTSNNQTYRGETTWSTPIYRNAWAAEKKLPTYKENHTQVAYSSTNPQISTLNHAFPYKFTAYMMILWGVYLYFFWIFRKVY